MFGEGEKDKGSGNDNGGGGMLSKRLYTTTTQATTSNNHEMPSASKIGIFRPKSTDMENALKICTTILKKI